MFQYFCQSGLEFSKWKSDKHFRIDENCGWGVENSHQVLPGGSIYARLAAVRGDNQRQERGGHMHEVYTPHVRGSDKSGQVSDHAAAKGNDRCVSTVASAAQLVG